MSKLVGVGDIAGADDATRVDAIGRRFQGIGRDDGKALAREEVDELEYAG